MPPGPSNSSREVELWQPQPVQKQIQQQQQEQTPVCIMWDYENVRIPSDMPSAYTACSLLRQIASTYGPIRQFRAYMETELERGDRKTQNRSALQSSGVTVADTPHNGGKEVADKQLIVDLFTFALDHPHATFVLISGDKDFAYACSTLRNRQYRIVLVCPEVGVNESLRQSCDQVVYWRTQVLGLPMRSAGGAAPAKRLRTNQQPQQQPHYNPQFYQQQPHQQQPAHYVPYTYAQPAIAGPSRPALPPPRPPPTFADHAIATAARLAHQNLPAAGPSISTSTAPAPAPSSKEKEKKLPRVRTADQLAASKQKKERKRVARATAAAAEEKAKEGKGKKRKIEVIELGSSSEEDEREDEDEEGFILPPSVVAARLPAALPPKPKATERPPPKRAPMAGDPLPLPSTLTTNPTASTSKSKSKIARLARPHDDAGPSSDLIIVPSSARKLRPSTSASTSAAVAPTPNRRSSLRSSTTNTSASALASTSAQQADSDAEEVVVSAPQSSASKLKLKSKASSKASNQQQQVPAAEPAHDPDSDGYSSDNHPSLLTSAASLAGQARARPAAERKYQRMMADPDGEGMSSEESDDGLEEEESGSGSGSGSEGDEDVSAMLVSRVNGRR